MPFLSPPSEAYKDSYIEAVREFQAEGRYYMHLDVERLADDFGSHVRDLLRRSDRATQDPDLVPETFWWLVDGDEYIGRVSIRHELTDKLLRHGGHIGYDIRPSKRGRGYGRLILKLALEKARAMGLRRVLITCHSDNPASRKIVEANGGVLENEIRIDGQPGTTLRYWIAIA